MVKASVKTILLLFLFGVLALVSSYNFNLIKRELDREKAQYILVEGNVKKPGFYKINPIATNLDILKQAGLNDSSDITQINLISAANTKQSLEVGVSKKKITRKALFLGFNSPKLAYFLGDVIIKKKSRLRKAKVNQQLEEGDIIVTRSNGKAKIIFFNFTEMDLSENTKLMLKSLGGNEAPSSTTIKIKSGNIRIKYPNSAPGTALRIVTATAKIALDNQSSEAVISAEAIKSFIQMKKGRAEVVPVGGGERKSLSGGESFTVWRGKAKIEKTVKLSRKKDEKSIFKNLDQAYGDFKKSQEETSLLITSGGFNMVITMIPKKKRIVFMDLPPDTYIGEYMDGAFRLDQAVALSGSETAREIVRRIIGRPVQFVLSMNYQSAYNFAYSLDGLNLAVDGGAALSMRISPGMQRLSREKILQFLNPNLPGGPNMAVRRQKMVFMAFLKRIKSSGPASYATFVDDVVRLSNTNLRKKEALKFFRIFMKIDNWAWSNVRMPSKSINFGPVSLVKPEYNRIREFYN